MPCSKAVMALIYKRHHRYNIGTDISLIRNWGEKSMLVENIMFSLIRSEICGSVLEDTLRCELTAETLSDLYTLSQKHDLSHIIASALSKMKVLGNDEISQKYTNQLMMAAYRDRQKEHAIEQTCLILENAKIPHIPLKGSVIRKLYPQAWMRTSCDVDILVHKDDAEAAIACLCNAGFVRFNDRSIHDYNLLSPNKVHIELHYTLTQDGKLTAADEILNSVWSYTTPEDECTYCRSMEPEMFLLYHLAHMGRHLLHGGCGVRPFIDLWLIRHKMALDPSKLNALLENTKLGAFYDAVSDLSEVWLGDRTRSNETELLEKFILSGGTYGTTTNAETIKAARGINKVRSFLSVMFLPRKNLAVLYPNLKKHPFLFPFYQVKRWFRIFKSDKRQKIQHLTNTRNAVTKAEANSALILLEHLGLTE